MKAVIHKPYSMQSVLVTVILVMGALAISTALVTGQIFRDQTFESQTLHLAQLIDVETQVTIAELEKTSIDLIAGLAKEPRFKQAYSNVNRTALIAELNEQFAQYYVTAGVVDLKRLAVYDVDMNLLAESTSGDPNTPSVSLLCEGLIQLASTRRGVSRLKAIPMYCPTEDRTYYSVLTSFGGLSPKGYIQLLVDPVRNLIELENMLSMPIKVTHPLGQLLFQSEEWPTKEVLSQSVHATNTIFDALAEPALHINAVQTDNHLRRKLAATRYTIVAGVSGATLLAVVLMHLLLRRTTLLPIRKLNSLVERVSSDKDALGETVELGGNLEIRQLANNVNLMSGELKDVYDKLEKMAFTDALTSLPNRALFQDRIEQLIKLSKREARNFCVMMMDLDRFKEVNDTLGHEYGDKLLQLVSERISNELRGSDTVSVMNSDTVARLGGDEFSVLLPTTHDIEGAAVVARKICGVLETPFEIDGHTFSIGISIGIAMFPTHGDDAPTIIRHADIAMYTAKKAQKGYAFYDKSHDEHTLENLTLSNELRQTINEGKLDVHFQPKIDFTSGTICGTEALARWHNGSRGAIPPQQFIPLAEKVGLIAPLTTLVLNRSMEQIARWQHEGVPLSVAVNLSPTSLTNDRLVDEIEEVIHTWKIPPSSLILELTESAVMENPEHALKVLNELHRLGLTLSIDDFGTGYSSLAYLKRLPVEEIKIDQSFVIDMARSKQDVMIIQSTIELAHRLGKKVIAEGIEDRQVYEMLKKMGCDMGQGFHMGHPSSREDLSKWLDTSPWGLKKNQKKK